MHWQDYCDIRVSGRGVYRFVERLRQSPVSCGEQRCAGEVFCGRILRRDADAARTLAASLHLEFSMRPLPSVVGRAKRFRLRFGILAGVVLAAVLIFRQSNVVETIEIQGAVTADEQTILAILGEEGVTRGTWIGDIDMLHCERRIRAAVPEVAWAGIRHTGSRLVVEIAEARPNIGLLREREPCNIVSQYDAQITGVRVNAGQLCRILGDGVAKGELLVSGVYTDGHGKTSYVHANAAITGIYTREAELTAYLDRTERLPTGNSLNRRWLRIFGLRIPLTAGRAAFAESKVSVSEVPLAFLGFTLPCAIVQETAEELAVQEYTLTEDEARREVNADIVRYEKNLLRDVTILSREIEYRTDENCVTALVSYRVEGEIGTQSELFLLP